MSDEICRCSHPKEFHQSFLKEVPCDYDGKCVGGCQKFEPVGSDRHPKWQRVEPGTVIPAGQPYRVEYVKAGERFSAGTLASEGIPGEPYIVPNYGGSDWFIDSSWKPPLVLPTTPTWGIAVHQAGSFTDQWFTVPERPGRLINGRGAKLYAASVLDFIPLTDEQVARIEQAR